MSDELDYIIVHPQAFIFQCPSQLKGSNGGSRSRDRAITININASNITRNFRVN
jgi:hypothetical protein